jgi:CPA1 family monovalent cation:H+ antiporter
LFVSWNGPLLIPAATRLQGIFFWDLVIYLLEGFVFLVTGLQARTLFDRLDTVLLRDLGLAVLLTVVVTIIARFIWVYPAIYLPRWLSPALARRDPSPPWQWAFFLAFVGVRGVVSLAAALAIPLTTAAGAPFPNRDLILFITFGLIIVTLVGQGLLLPGGQGRWMWRKTGWNSSWRMAKFRPGFWRSCGLVTNIERGGCQAIRQTGSTPLR